jgi:hypothetical protein
MNNNPKLFIGSASETLAIANALEYELRNDAKMTKLNRGRS